MSKEKLGIIQSRGLGDILIALPIAKYHHDQGKEIYWPICQEFWPSVKDIAPWVNWLPVITDPTGQFFYDRPQFELAQKGVTDTICLYQALTGHPELAGRPYFQFQKFDEHKYTAAGVPFVNKWKLSECITRQASRETALYNKLVKNEKYYVTHLSGSSYRTQPDLSYIPEDWQRIDVDENITECVFDWIKILENAQAIIALDSVIANLVDQLLIDVDKYWIPRSHIHLTPILGSTWTILPAPEDSLAAKRLFASAQ